MYGLLNRYCNTCLVFLYNFYKSFSCFSVHSKLFRQQVALNHTFRLHAPFRVPTPQMEPKQTKGFKTATFIFAVKR